MREPLLYCISIVWYRIPYPSSHPILFPFSSINVSIFLITLTSPLFFSIFLFYAKERFSFHCIKSYKLGNRYISDTRNIYPHTHVHTYRTPYHIIPNVLRKEQSQSNQIKSNQTDLEDLFFTTIYLLARIHPLNSLFTILHPSFFAYPPTQQTNKH